MAPSPHAPRRRGRPPEAERVKRRDQALDAALAEIARTGYDRMTMSAVAARAGSSKESLYSWFGSKQDMVAELIRRQSAATNAVVEEALTSGRAPRDILCGIARGLLALLTSGTSLALNKAAMTSPELAAGLLRHGRHTTGPLIESYLAELGDENFLALDDAAEAFRLLYGLVVQDTQIRSLLGETPPTPQQCDRQACLAVDRFLALTASEGVVKAPRPSPSRWGEDLSRRDGGDGGSGVGPRTQSRASGPPRGTHGNETGL